MVRDPALAALLERSAWSPPASLVAAVECEPCATKRFNLHHGKDGKFASGDGGARGIRDVFAGPNTITSLEAEGQAELSRIVGQHVAVKLTGLDLEAGRAHLEGIARGAEMFPHTDLISVTSFGPRGHLSDIPGQTPGAHDKAWGVTSSTPGRRGADIYLNTRVDAPKMRRVQTKAVAEGLADADSRDITWTGNHEMGHAAHASLQPGKAQDAALHAAVRHGGTDVQGVHDHVKTEISTYAATSPHELIGEAVAQVGSLGSKASPLARDIVGEMQANWDSWEL